MPTKPPKVRENAAVPDPVRTVRVPDELWQAAQDKAWSRRESVADVIRRALVAYVEED
jgi:hypothetical protein